MDNLTLIAREGELKPEEKMILTEGLLAHHASQGHPRRSTIYSILLKDKEGRVQGGIIVSYLWNGMEILSLWVSESLRKQGRGRKLVEAAEIEAIKRGCTIAYTNTFTWQAGDFYTKMGYSIYGKLEDFPKDNSLTFYRKNLVSQDHHSTREK